MNKVIFSTFLIVSLSANAVTENADGSITFTKEEAQNLLENFQSMEADSKKYEKDRAMAIQVLNNMQKYIKELEGRKCI